MIHKRTAKNTSNAKHVKIYHKKVGKLPQRNELNTCRNLQWVNSISIRQKYPSNSQLKDIYHIISIYHFPSYFRHFNDAWTSYSLFSFLSCICPSAFNQHFFLFFILFSYEKNETFPWV